MKCPVKRSQGAETTRQDVPETARPHAPDSTTTDSGQITGSGRITGQTRADLIETSYPEGYWQYDFTQNQLVYEDTKWHLYPLAQAHILYEDLPVHSKPDASSETIIIPADTDIYFLATDLEEWILVKGKNGSQGYMQVADEKIVDLNKAADEVISDLYFYD